MKLFSYRFASVLLVLFCSTVIFGQQDNKTGIKYIPKKISLRQDTAIIRKGVISESADSNFIWQKYADFLKKISDTSKYVVLPLNEFRKTFNSKKIVIGLRHDVDVDLNIAYAFSKIESGMGFRSSYFILHTAPYYLMSPSNMANHNPNILPILLKMQNENHFEIGWHNDLVTSQLIYNINSVNFLHDELNWLRSNGLRITGTAAHGSSYCKTYHYMNFYFFKECSYPSLPGRENNETVTIDGKTLTIQKSTLAAFNLEYEAYFLNNNKAYSDATITNGVRWNIGMLDLDALQKGDRVIILLHPIHWHKAKESTRFDSFFLPGQESCKIDTINHRIRVAMPNSINRSSLKAQFQLSAGAYAKVAGMTQMSTVSINNFTNPLSYIVYAENSSIKSEWIVEVVAAKNRADSLRAKTVLNGSDTVENPGLSIYPNPSSGNISMHFVRVGKPPTTIDIYNSKGEKVYSEVTEKTGEFTVQKDLLLRGGIYFVRYTGGKSPEKFLIKR